MTWKTVRMRADLHERVVAAAAADRRPVATWVELAVEAALAGGAPVQPRVGDPSAPGAGGPVPSGRVRSSADAKAGVRPIGRGKRAAGG